MSGGFKVLDASIDACEWRSILKNFEPALRDLYFEPEWAALHCLEEGAKALAFVFEGEEGQWFYSFILRPILRVGNEEISERGLSDIESAYGYGGPVSSSNQNAFLKKARRSFESWCREEKIVAEFLRFHPLLRSEQFVECCDHVTVIEDRPTAAIPLGGGLTSGVYSKNATSMIRRGKRAGYRVIEVASDQLPRFVTMYRDTMEMLGATEYYHFNANYFKGLEKLVSSRGHLLAVVGEEDEQWVSAGIFLEGELFSHYHLSASITTRRVPGATNLLLDHAAHLAKESGKALLHLGGGRTAADDDSLLKFKREMGSERHKFHIGKCVHLRSEYEQLVVSWEKQGGLSAGNPVLLRYRQII